MNGTQYFVCLEVRIVVTEEYNVVVNSDELISTTGLYDMI